jgi:hypothetical protein
MGLLGRTARHLAESRSSRYIYNTLTQNWLILLDLTLTTAGRAILFPDMEIQALDDSEESKTKVCRDLNIAIAI